MLSASDCADLRTIADGKGTGFRYADLARYLKRAGWEVNKGAGSHRTWRQKGRRRIVLPERNPVLPVYVRLVATRLLEEDCK